MKVQSHREACSQLRNQFMLQKSSFFKTLLTDCKVISYQVNIPPPSLSSASTRGTVISRNILLVKSKLVPTPNCLQLLRSHRQLRVLLRTLVQETPGAVPCHAPSKELFFCPHCQASISDKFRVGVRFFSAVIKLRCRH